MADDTLRMIQATAQIDPSDESHNFELYPWLLERARFYCLVSDLKQGSVGEGVYGSVFLCKPCKENGEEIHTEQQLVVKIAKVNDAYKTDDNEERLHRVKKAVRLEFKHVRKRLVRCEYANPIIDYGELQTDDFEIPATVQPFLQDYYDLDKWLLKFGLRDMPALKSEHGRYAKRNWDGIRGRLRWLEIAVELATALKELHLHRVTHGDIHPGNIFLKNQIAPCVKLIDFGESSLFMPTHSRRPKRKPNPYVAPELLGPRCALNEKVDVFAFGQVLLYLASGMEHSFSAEAEIGRHRSRVLKFIQESNRNILADEPRLLDIIGRATAQDPADRPRMVDLLGDLRSMLDPPKTETTGTTVIPRGSKVLKGLADKLEAAAANHHPVLVQMLEQQIAELAHSFEGLRTEMVQFAGTRDHSLRTLVALFESLHKQDSWTTVTTLDIWQHHALGLDGTYASANIRALKRGASVRRVFAISVEEIGVDFATELLKLLETEDNKVFHVLHQLLGASIDAYWKRVNEHIVATRKIITWRRHRFIKVIECLAEQIHEWDLGEVLNREPVVDFDNANGLVLGICPVAYMDDVVGVKEDNPASLLFDAKANEWLLIVTDAQGRRGRNGVSGQDDEVVHPHLLGVRVFQSIETNRVPNDRIVAFKKLFKDRAVNLCAVADDFAALAKKAQNLI